MYRLLVLFCLFFLCIPAYSEEPESIKIGVVLGLTGNASVHSDAIRKGAEYAVEELKQKGVSVKLNIQDDQTDPAKTVSSIQFLLSLGYKYFIGPTWSFQARAAEPILKREGAIALIPAGSSLINGGASPVFFNICPRRDKQLEPITSWLKGRKKLNTLILTPNGDWGEVHADVFEKAVRAAGGKVVGREAFDYGVDINTLKSIMTRVGRKNIDIIASTSSAADLASVVRAKNQLKLNAAILATHDLIDAFGQKLLSDNEKGEEVFISHLKAPGESFKAGYKKFHNSEAALYSDRAYDGVLGLVEAIQKTDGSVEAVKDYLGNKLDIQGSIGRVRFDQNGDLADGAYVVEKF